MSQNPYESPCDLTPQVQRQSHKRHACAAVAGWLFFFLLPSFGVFAAHAFPGPPFLDAPKGDTVLSRVSLMLGVPMEPLLLGSLLGCVVSGACFPVTLRWKAVAVFNAIVWWFPLILLQIMALQLALMALVFPPVT